MYYKDYLQTMLPDFISEEDFNEVLDTIPLNGENINFEYCYSLDDLASAAVQAILDKWPEVYVLDISFQDKSMSLDCVKTVKDLEEIKDTFKQWTIDNYDELINDIQENKIRTEYSKKRLEISNYIDDLSEEEFNNFYNSIIK